MKYLAEYCGTSLQKIQANYAKSMSGDDAQLALLEAIPPARKVA